MTLITSNWSECHMKKDAEVLRYMRERRKGTNQELAAARAGMSVKTARKYERAGKLPSQLMQLSERGGKRLAQRYRQRTLAMAVGRTKRRWTAREVLSYPLLPVSA